MNMKKKRILLVSVAAVATTMGAMAQGEYVCGDFHQHSAYTDGSWTIGAVMRKNMEYGLDWWANSEHGGAFATWGRHGGWDEVNGVQYMSDVKWNALSTRDGGTIIKGDNAESGNMWRWQSLSEFSIYDIIDARILYPEKLILQGYEYNPAGHEHADVCIIEGQFGEKPAAEALAEFEYKFDANDTDKTGGAEKGWVKSTKEGKEKNLEALQWLQENYKGKSWMIPTHPERKCKYSIADFRNMNNVAPDVCFGFDSQPGHQKGASRGGYSASAFEGIEGQGATWGGTGAMAARVGGMWDALLSEGRNWWLFANSDFHDIEEDFFPGEYQKTYTFVESNDAEALVKGLRSGNSWIVTGDLINSLEFRVDENVMGSTLALDAAKEVTIYIKVCDPESANHNTYSDYTNPALDHIDLIAGEITGMVDPTSENYDNPNAPATKVIARFDAKGGVTDANGIVSTAWKDLGNGVKEIEYKVNIEKPMYFRLRGTNLGLGVAGETDENGNPLVDIAGENTAAKAFADLWFYSNPIFVTLKNGAENATSALTVNQMEDRIEICGAVSEASIVNLSGVAVEKETFEAGSDRNVIMTNSLPAGSYILVMTAEGQTVTRKIAIR